MYDLSFCHNFSYPPELENFLVKILDTLVSQNVISIILSGSLSRGEMSYLGREGSLKIYSDFEFFVVTKKKKKMKKKEITKFYKNIRHLEILLNKQSRFTHLDISFLSLKDITRLPPRLQFLETKKAGLVLYGKDLRHLFPDGVDLKSVNESSLNRLWSLILYFPSNILLGKASLQEQTDYKYILARSVLDIPTWLLSHSGNFVFGFQDRVNLIKRNYERFSLGSFFPPWFPEFLHELLQSKSKFAFPYDLITLYEKVLTCYACATNFVLSKIYIALNPENIPKALIEYSPHIFDEFLFTRKIFELILLSKTLKCTNLVRSIKWYNSSKKGTTAAFLFSMNYALLSYLREENKFEPYLEQAQSYLLQLDFRLRKIESVSFPEKWLHLRRKYIDFLVFFYRWFAIKKNYLESVLE